jgi:hypothetical protein
MNNQDPGILIKHRTGCLRQASVAPVARASWSESSGSCMLLEKPGLKDAVVADVSSAHLAEVVDDPVIVGKCEFRVATKSDL